MTLCFSATRITDFRPSTNCLPSPSMHVMEAALVGAHVGTMPFRVLEMMFHHPLTDIGLEKFAKDWEKANLKDLQKALG